MNPFKKPMEWFRIKKPVDLRQQFSGARITCYPTARDAWQRTNGAKLLIEQIRGNLTHQTMFEVNGSHLVSMLDAYSELNREPLPSREIHEGFLSTVATHVQEPGLAPGARGPSLIDRKKH